MKRDAGTYVLEPVACIAPCQLVFVAHGSLFQLERGTRIVIKSLLEPA